MSDNPHKQFPGKMDQHKKRTYKTGYGKLKHIGLFESFDTNEAITAKVTTKKEVEETKTKVVTKKFLNKVEELAALSEEYKALESVLDAMKKKAEKIKLLKDELLPDLQKFNAQFLRIGEFLVEVDEQIKTKSARTMYSYKEISEAFEAMIPVTEEARKAIEATKEMNKTVHPGEVLKNYEVKVSRVQEGAVIDWIKEAFGTLAAKFKSMWTAIVGSSETLEGNLDTLSAKLQPIGLKVPSTADVIDKN